MASADLVRLQCRSETVLRADARKRSLSAAPVGGDESQDQLWELDSAAVVVGEDVEGETGGVTMNTNLLPLHEPGRPDRCSTLSVQ